MIKLCIQIFKGEKMMNFKKQRSATFIKYIVSYFALLMIPVLIISIIIQLNIFKEYKREIIANAKTSQENVAYNLKNGFTNCLGIVDQLIIGNNLTVFSLENNPGKAIELVQTLKGYSATNKFFDHVFVHFFDETYIYSETSSYTTSSFFNVFVPKNIDSRELMNNLYNVSKPTIWKDIIIDNTGKQKNYILYSLPLVYSSIPKGFVTFLIDSDKISSLLDNSSRAKTSLLLDYNGKVLYDANIDKYFYTKENLEIIEDTIKNLRTDTERFKTNESYSVYSEALDATGVVYISIIETKALFSKFIIAQRKIYFGIILSLVIGSFVIYFIMKLTYNPVLKLKKLASSISRKSFMENDEFELIKSTLNYFFERNNELENELLDNLPARQYYLLSQVINGNIIIGIQNSLRNEEIDNLKSQFSELMEIISHSDYPIEILKKIFVEIMVLFDIYFEKNKGGIEHVNIDFQQVYEISDVNSLKKVFSDLINEVLSVISKKLENKLPSLSVNSIKDIIEHNYRNYDFSLQSMASYFGISVSYLSQYFKERTGSTILDYITELKMEESKKLLRTTELALKEIAEHVGYVNMSSFIRRFKQVTGKTPGEYKRNYQD
jgi:AraC-like DNA-binding protein